MISQELHSLEEAYHRLLSSLQSLGDEYALAQAEAEHLYRVRPAFLAKLAQEHQGSMSAKESLALASTEYIDFLDQLKSVETFFLRKKLEFKTLEAQIELLNHKINNRRADIKVFK